jgi:hypothetical protein
MQHNVVIRFFYNACSGCKVYYCDTSVQWGNLSWVQADSLAQQSIRQVGPATLFTDGVTLSGTALGVPLYNWGNPTQNLQKSQGQTRLA